MNTQPSRFLPYLVLGVGLLAISFGAVLARFAQAAHVPSLSVAAWRLGLAAIVVTPFALYDIFRPQRRPVRATSPAEPQQWGWALAAGFCLAAHFATWVTSLEYTSVASSAALVTTNPLWIGLFTYYATRELPKRQFMIGMGISLLGSFLIFLSDSQYSASGENTTLGNSLALLGALFFSAYLLIGRRLRARLSLSVYVWLAYGIAACFLFISAVFSGQPLLGFSAMGWWALLGMTLGPQLIGHTSYNWALKHVSPALVAVVTLGEPVGGAIMAFIFLGESIGPLQGVGFVLLLMGIYFSARAEAV